MNRRTALVAALVFIVVVGGVQLLDPQFGERSPPEVDYSEPPAEVAADAATQFEYVDYAYRIDIADNRSGEWEQVRTTWIDNTDREYRKSGPGGEQGIVLYSTDDVSFIRAGIDATWRVLPTRGTLYPARLVTQPLSVEQIRTASVSVVTENGSRIILYVDTSVLKFVDDYPGNTIILINKNTGLVEQAFVTYDAGQGQPRHLRLEVIQKDVEVERPSEISISPRMIFWDLLRGPLTGL